jgi:signal transduction histidine kinase
MTESWRQLVRSWRQGGLALALPHSWGRLLDLLKISTPDIPELMRRIRLMERDIILPLKAAGILMLLQSFYVTPWFKYVSTNLDLPVEYTLYFLWFYISLNLLYAVGLFSMRRLPPGLLEWLVFAMGLVDAIFLGALTLVTGGYNSILYWLFLGLIVRSAVSVPRPTSQLALNLTLSTCYVLAGFIDAKITNTLPIELKNALELNAADNPAEPLFLRLALLLLMTFGCYGVQVLLAKQRQAEEEAREFAFREGQLRSAGRLAAEFAHQIKNPLAIINNAAFSLQRSLNHGQTDVSEHIQIIQEEVEHSDRIITEIMGYAQLSEGRVEKLDVLEEIDSAIKRVFPRGAGYNVQVHRDYAGNFPPLMMQRRHLAETVVNVLQNAREAVADRGGNVFVKARCTADYCIEISVRDDGPGIPPEKQERVFEAYYTTKEKGTGLGLATVKHNVELYGGKVRLESELGKGACFVLTFHAKPLTQTLKPE